MVIRKYETTYEVFDVYFARKRKEKKENFKQGYVKFHEGTK
jgi:hypothetical protein